MFLSLCVYVIFLTIIIPILLSISLSDRVDELGLDSNQNREESHAGRMLSFKLMSLNLSLGALGPIPGGHKKTTTNIKTNKNLSLA
jgi:hypothetical protein